MIRLIIVSLLLLLSLIWNPILIFIIPGILLLFLPAFKKIDLVDLLIYIIGTSVSFWISLFWFLKFIPLSLTGSFWLITIITTILVIYFLFKKAAPYKILSNYSDFILIFLFIFVAILRFTPMTEVIVPAGADMSFHTAVTNLIVAANDVPQNYHPIFEIDEFDTYPAGFHTISALVALVGGLASYQGAFIVSCLTYILITLFLFVFLKKYVTWELALISSVSFWQVPRI